MTLTLPTLTIPQPWWLTSNGRYHYMDKARRTRCIREAAALTYRGRKAPGTGPWLVVAHIGYPTAGRVDPPNAWPAIKAAIDGAVDAGVFPDDSDEFLVGPLMLRAPGRTQKGVHKITLTITDQEVPWLATA